MIFGSVCSGIEAASVAWHPLGWRAAFLSEIEAFPRSVLTARQGAVDARESGTAARGVPLWGDFTTIRPRHLRRLGVQHAIDLLVGGTPCQSFSIAGLRGGLDDERGNLALEYLRLARRLRPRWLVWENVPGVLSSNGGRDFGAILGGMVKLGYGIAYRVLDAQYFGVAQRRRRVFVVGYLGDWRRAAAVLFERESLCGDPAPRREAGPRSAAGTLGGTSPGGGWRFGADEAAAGHLITANTLRAGTPKGDGAGRHDHLVVYPSAVRRLMPIECERLQGFPDGYTDVPYRGKPAADGPRYESLGNSMAVPVMRWIGERIQMVDQIPNMLEAAE